MQLRDKLILAGLVLGVGGSGAFWFRKTGDEPQPVADAPAKHLVLREEFRPNAPPDAAGQTPLASQPLPPRAPSIGEAQSAPKTFDHESPLPNLAPNYQPAFNIRNPRGQDKSPVQTPTPLTPLNEQRDTSSVSFGTYPAPTTGAFPPLTRNAPAEETQPVTHRIVDGDTLARLAEMYLGNASRRLEIFDANRGVLKDPEVLPIGAELKIPPKIASAPASIDATSPPPLVPLRH